MIFAFLIVFGLHSLEASVVYKDNKSKMLQSIDKAIKSISAQYIPAVYKKADRLLVAQPGICPQHGEKLRLLLLVSSMPERKDARATVRLTWGHYARRSDVALAFVIGKPASCLKDSIKQENDIYGDIVIGNFKEAYYNSALKTISMFKWVERYCRHASRILKTDDDIFINVQRVLTYISKPKRIKATLTIWGRLLKKIHATRDADSRYYIPVKEYRKSILPRYVAGPTYLMTGDVISTILTVMSTEPYVRVEDVFITGILAKKAGIRRKNIPHFLSYYYENMNCKAVSQIFAFDGVPNREVFELWSKLDQPYKWNNSEEENNDKSFSPKFLASNKTYLAVAMRELVEKDKEARKFEEHPQHNIKETMLFDEINYIILSALEPKKQRL